MMVTQVLLKVVLMRWIKMVSKVKVGKAAKTKKLRIKGLFIMLLNFKKLAMSFVLGYATMMNPLNAMESMERHKDTAQLKLTEMDFLGLGDQINDATARQAFAAVLVNKAAVPQDKMTAQFTLAKMDYFGLGGAVNYETARQGFSFVCTKKATTPQVRVSAKFMLAEMDYYGKGYPVDYLTARQGYTAVATNKYSTFQQRASAEFKLAQMDYFGQGCRVIYSTARQGYAAVVRNNSAIPSERAAAQLLLAQMEFLGLGGPVNLIAAKQGFSAVVVDNAINPQDKILSQFSLDEIENLSLFNGVFGIRDLDIIILKQIANNYFLDIESNHNKSFKAVYSLKFVCKGWNIIVDKHFVHNAIKLAYEKLGYVEEYQRYYEGELTYTTEKGEKVVLRIADLVNPLGGEFDLSKCGIVDRFLSINTGYKQKKRAKNETKLEIWFAPRFLIEKELNVTASHFERIFPSWLDTAPVGLLWTVGEWGNLWCIDYLTTKNSDSISNNNLQILWNDRKSQNNYTLHKLSLQKKMSNFRFKF